MSAREKITLPLRTPAAPRPIPRNAKTRIRLWKYAKIRISADSQRITTSSKYSKMTLTQKSVRSFRKLGPIDAQNCLGDRTKDLPIRGMTPCVGIPQSIKSLHANGSARRKQATPGPQEPLTQGQSAPAGTKDDGHRCWL